MPEVKHYPGVHVAYVSEVGPYGEAVQRGFGRLFAGLAAQNLPPLGPPIGIYYDSPQTAPPDRLRCDLCVPIPPHAQVAEGIATMDIGDIDVVATVYEGAQNIQRGYDEVYAWLNAHGYYPAGAPMETYLNRPGEELRAEIEVPVRKMA